MAWLGRTPVTSRGLMQPSVSPWAAERTKAERWTHLCPHASQWAGDPLLCWAVLMPQLLSPVWHTCDRKRCHERVSGYTPEAGGTDGDVTSFTASHQPGVWQLMAASRGAAHGESPEPPTDAGGQVMAFPAAHWAQRGWAVLLVWQGASRRPGSPIPAGRCLAAGQRCPAAGGPQSGTRHCQQAACCLLDSEIWPQLARIQFNYDKQHLHPLSCD